MYSAGGQLTWQFMYLGEHKGVYERTFLSPDLLSSVRRLVLDPSARCKINTWTERRVRKVQFFFRRWRDATRKLQRSTHQRKHKLKEDVLVVRARTRTTATLSWRTCGIMDNNRNQRDAAVPLGTDPVDGSKHPTKHTSQQLLYFGRTMETKPHQAGANRPAARAQWQAASLRLVREEAEPGQNFQ